MTLDLAFWAEEASSARRQAREWAAAEPNVDSCRVVSVKRHETRLTWWTVTVRLVMRQRHEQGVLFAEVPA